MKYKNNLITQYEKVAGNNGLDLETFVSYSGYTLDQFKELMEKNAQNIVAEEMIFQVSSLLPSSTHKIRLSSPIKFFSIISRNNSVIRVKVSVKTASSL